MSSRLPLSVRETLRIARLHCTDGERGSIDLAERWITAGCDEIDRLRAELEEAKLSDIAARNPGIDIDKVRKFRRSQP